MDAKRNARTLPKPQDRFKTSVRSDEGLTLETPASFSIYGRNFTLINLLDVKFQSFSFLFFNFHLLKNNFVSVIMV